MLQDNPWDGGGGYTAEQVANMTLDQVWARLCDKNLLKREVGKRTQKVVLEGAGALTDKQGKILARSATGEEIKLRSAGMSKARMLREGTYEGWAINASTGQKEWITPKKKAPVIKSRRKSRK